MAKGKKAPVKKPAAGGKKPPQSATTTDDDEDWDAILEAETSKTKVDPIPAAPTTSSSDAPNDDQKKEETQSTATPAPAALDAAAAFLAAQGLNVAGSGAADKNKKKKKKKPAGGGGAGGGGGEKDDEMDDVDATPAPAPPSSTGNKKNEKISAKGKLVQERLRKQKEEEERIRAAEEAERQRIAEIEAREAEIERLKEEERQKKKQKEKEKIERQKAEGTYMTKAQKQKKKLAEQRLQATLNATGIVVAAGVGGVDQTTATTTTSEKPVVKKASNLYDNRKKKGGNKSQQQQHQENQKPDGTHDDEKVSSQHADDDVEDWEKVGDDDDDIKEEADNVTKKEQNEDEAPTKDDDDDNDDGDEKKEDDDDDSGDEWDADTDDEAKFDDLAERLEKVQMNANDGLDLIELEKQKEKERLRELGLKRAEQERIDAERRAMIEAEQNEEARRQLMAKQIREDAKNKRLKQEKENLANRSPDNLRCPIVVIMGHVDTGKTTLLDKIRKTNVQEGEAGGITQQIGATYFEKTTLQAQTSRLNAVEKVDIKIPGMLVIDTPGHESFANLRSRGSSLCDVAILVVDLMHGLEQQTIESLNMLRKREVPFVVALNKVDRCYGWKVQKDAPIRESLKDQDSNTLQEFRSRATDAKVQLQEQGVNSNIYWEMGDEDWTNSDFIPLVPTSGVTGEGVQDVLLLLCQMAQRKLVDSLMWHANLQCTVLEVKAIDGLGMTVDVLVVNGTLHEGDRAVFCTLDGPIVTEIRGLLTPPPSREMRIKSEYIHHKEVKGALGVKVIGNNLDKVMAGTPVMVVGKDDEEEDIKSEVMADLASLQNKLSTEKVGVLVQASTLGALEALLQFLREDTKPPIPVSAIGIGTVHKRDVTKISIMNEKGCSEYATILAFDVPIEREAREHAIEMNVRIMTADIIYHLFDQFTRFMTDLNEKRRAEASAVAVFPSIIKILPQHIFNQKDPIIVGVEIVDGILKVGTPLCVPALGGLFVGKVDSIESNGNMQETAKKGTSVAVRIVNESNPTITYGRQFDSTNMLYSTLTRQSIDALKLHFKDQLSTDDWKLVVKLKKVFNII